MFSCPRPCFHVLVHVSMSSSMFPCPRPCFHVLVHASMSSSMFPCPRSCFHVLVHVSMSLFMSSVCFCIRKMETQISVCLLQTETKTEVCFPWLANDYQQSTIAVPANVPIYGLASHRYGEWSVITGHSKEVTLLSNMICIY
jgi:hypothetical protein